MRIECRPMTNFNHPNSTPSSFRTKLGSYVTGLAIGFILLGFFMYQKSRAEKRDAQRIQQQLDQSQQVPTGSTP